MENYFNKNLADEFIWAAEDDVLVPDRKDDEVLIDGIRREILAIPDIVSMYRFKENQLTFEQISNQEIKRQDIKNIFGEEVLLKFKF